MTGASDPLRTGLVVDELAEALASGTQQQVDAVLFTTATIFGVHRQHVVELIHRHRLPTTGFSPFDVQAGALSSYGISWQDFWRSSVAYVDKILKGARPSELPVAQPTRFELWVNARTAAALGVTIPRPVLMRADHILQ
jgi:putative ABC transport system substrate-binding protein